MTTTLTRSAPDSAPTPERRVSARLPGIDGLRALAVVLVVLYHLTPGTTIGGYIGVDVFFVISGFLITGLLLRERERDGRIRFRSFWARRARRILPALALVVLVSTSVALVIGGDVLVGIGRQVLGAATFSFNWLDIAHGTTYFGQSTPELFRNLWSLAVEEQFYLVWPLLVALIAILHRGRTRIAVAVGIALLSAIAMALLLTPGGDVTRVYYGTDTHSFGLALGAALAFLVDARPPATWTASARRWLAGAGPVAFLGIIALALVLDADAALTYRGGLAAVAVLSAIAIAACIAPRSPLATLLDLAPIRWIGERSYGIYLWHWPVFVLLVAAVPALSGDTGIWILGVGAAVVTVLAAMASYRLLETPIRRNGLRATARSWARAARATRPGAARAAIAGTAVVAVVALTGMALIVAPQKTGLETRIDQGNAAIAHAKPSVLPPAPPAGPGAPPSPAASTGLAAMPTGDQITALGDSVMVAVSPQLEEAFPGIDIHAAVSRQMYSAPDIIKKFVTKGTLRPVLLLGLGTNGPITDKELDRITNEAGPQTSIVLVNVQAPRKWTKSVNAHLAQYAATHRNVELADWQTPIHKKLKLLYADKIHPKTAAGGRIYAGVVTDALTRLIAQPAAPALDMGLFRRNQ